MHRHHWNRPEHHSRQGWGGHLRDHLRGRHGRGSGGRLGRILEHGDLRFVVLALVSEKSRHGYEVMKDLEDRTGGAYRPSPGVIYPTFSLLEDEGFVTQVGVEGGRKAYEITDAGREALENNRAGVDAIFARLDAAGSQSTDARPKLQRAMQNLGTALALRMQRGPVTEAEIDAMAAAIDEAAARVERT